MSPTTDATPEECIICGELSVVNKYGFTFCSDHRGYSVLEPEDLECIVLWQIAGLPEVYIKQELDSLLTHKQYREDTE
jgi:hypothetical protein